MSSQCYPKARERFGTAQLDWTAGTLRCLLLPESYNPDFEDEYLSDISAGVRIATSDAMTGRTMTDGYANSDPIRFPLLLDNRLAAKAIIFKDTGVENTSVLIFLMDEAELVSAPFELEGFDYFIYPNTLGGGFFRL